MRARYYDPATGTFISADPLGSLGSGQNLYGYVGGDPVNFVDPLGLYGISNLWDDFSGTLREMPAVAWEHRGSLLAAAGAGACALSAGTACLVIAAAAMVNAIGTGTWQAVKGCWRSARANYIGGLIPPGGRTAGWALSEGQRLLKGTGLAFSRGAEQAQRAGISIPTGIASGVFDEMTDSVDGVGCGC